MNFQGLIFAFNQYWAEQGCIIMQPYDMEVGAGTFHPATFLAAVGPEPAKNAYVQPSRRPTDGRYGENPNRLQHYFQYQVVLKPSPQDFQDLYINSLVHIGIDPLKDDIRFVEDDWESPTLGAWGLGWEVWLNGMEVTQITYFQQVGGLECRPVTGEITYGLERLAMYVQGVDNVFELDWADGLKYGDVYFQNEFEQSRYNFEEADTKAHFAQFDACERASKKLANDKLPLPAYEQVLRASHTFNLLDARRVISVTERARYIARVRALASGVAESYFFEREFRGFPRLLETHDISTDKSRRFNKSPDLPKQHVSAATLLLELGTEELPPATVQKIGLVLEREIKNELLLVQLIDSVETPSRWFCTPRRVTVVVEQVLTHSSEKEHIRRGPPLQRAFDDAGKPTKAALGFARSCDVEIDQLETITVNDSTYLAYRHVEPSKQASELVTQCIHSALKRLPIDKKMRWGKDAINEFVRPLHWVVLLHGKQPIACEILGVKSGNTSRGHRFLGQSSVTIDDANEYLEALKNESVIADWNERRQLIEDQICEIEKSVDGNAMNDDSLLDEVTSLVELPQAFCGQFDSRFLELPPEVLISSMRHHQKYFPIFGKQDELLPKFIGVTNIKPVTQRIITGNERVLLARLSDAEFFWDQDRKISLNKQSKELDRLVFHRKLGSVKNKSMRVANLAGFICEAANLKKMPVSRAAKLAKADLVTEIVGEFPDLQGVMGKYYAYLDGEHPDVVKAIEEHYMPRSAAGELPKSECGMVIAIADRIDSLLGLMSVGEMAKGDRDPFSLRRMALGVLRIIIERKFDLDLVAILHASAEIYRSQIENETLAQDFATNNNRIDKVFDFTMDRLRAYFLDQGYLTDEFNAVYELKPRRPLEFEKRLQAVRQFRSLAECEDLVVANKRIVNILAKNSVTSGTTIDTRLLKHAAEINLYQQAKVLDDEVEPLAQAFEHTEILRRLAILRDPIDTFFDDVMVMDENQELRQNRIALVSFVHKLFHKVADISKLQVSKEN